jgi:hypothetical protein
MNSGHERIASRTPPQTRDLSRGLARPHALNRKGVAVQIQARAPHGGLPLHFHRYVPGPTGPSHRSIEWASKKSLTRSEKSPQSDLGQSKTREGNMPGQEVYRRTDPRSAPPLWWCFGMMPEGLTIPQATLVVEFLDALALFVDDLDAWRMLSSLALISAPVAHEFRDPVGCFHGGDDHGDSGHALRLGGLDVDIDVAAGCREGCLQVLEVLGNRARTQPERDFRHPVSVGARVDIAQRPAATGSGGASRQFKYGAETSRRVAWRNREQGSTISPQGQGRTETEGRSERLGSRFSHRSLFRGSPNSQYPPDCLGSSPRSRSAAKSGWRSVPAEAFADVTSVPPSRLDRIGLEVAAAGRPSARESLAPSL